MKTLFHAAALAAILLAGCISPGDVNQKPIDKPYAAGAPSGGIPLWKPGEKFVGIAGGACLGTCPVYELYVFDDGRVIFSGKKFTGKTGVFNKQMEASVYAELLTTIVRTRVLDDGLKRGTCLADHPMLTVMRSAPGGQSVRTASLNTGCEGHEDIAKQIESQFILFTEIESWLAPAKGR
jgi:Domain of unknown function (DUF6438)